MKIQRNKLLRLAASSAAGLAMAQAVSAATILTGQAGANNAGIDSNHGSNAVGTPNVTLTWDNGGVWEVYNDWDAEAGNLVYQVDGDGAGTVTHQIVLTPDAGWNVILSSFDVDDWAGGGGDSSLDWDVTGSVSGSIDSGTYTQPDGTKSALAFNVTGSNNETLTLSITQTGGFSSYLAMDNLSFDQVAVPEPSSALLGAIGLGAMAMRRRRK
ncbi:hypothetical protein NT6N_10480 [Oceaniferula spumae]|uniref:Ice-binding protein C-terminal domain-containing protein n=1 Tax=Oceaniferula spumae TaxID=2979115 RepID=A0AAT9FJ18_9BACT